MENTTNELLEQFEAPLFNIHVKLNENTLKQILPYQKEKIPSPSLSIYIHHDVK